MKIVFVSNYYNHHQHALCAALDRMTGGEFAFIATSEMREERKLMGYGMDRLPAYVKKAYAGEAESRQCKLLIDSADVVIAGAAPEKMIAGRIRRGKLVLRYAERPLKQKTSRIRYLPRLVRWHMRNPANKPVYMLCAGAYTAGDYAAYGLFRNRMYQWGYFPEWIQYADVQSAFSGKDPQKLLWAGRLLDWKHPEDAIAVMQRLRDAGYQVSLDMIGIGPMEQRLRQLIAERQLEDCVHLLGAMKPEQVREHMEHAGIFLFTSDKREGWGAVLNESMNSGCAVVASHAIGSVPYLLEDGRNGMVYRSGDVDMLYQKVKYLLDNPRMQNQLGQRAYEAIAQTWNSEVAAQRLIALSACLLAGRKSPDLYENGPCSKAELLYDN